MDDLTDRQREAVELLVQGCRNKEIAARLHLSKSSVEQRIAGAMAAVGVDTRIALAVWYVRQEMTTGGCDQPDRAHRRPA